MSYYALGHRLPRSLASPLFGDRVRFGVIPDEDDPTWQEWNRRHIEFYNANQRSSVGRIVNRAGHRIMADIDLTGKRVLEIGPGALDHIAFWNGMPAHFTCVDLDTSFMELAVKRLQDNGVPHNTALVSREHNGRIPVEPESYDVVLAFYSLEHIHPLQPHLDEVANILKPGGIFAGAIPCEGGLAWGLGRYLTSRRWLKKHTTINPDKLICWEHPNFGDDILNKLAQSFVVDRIGVWPLKVPLIDCNLVAKFQCRRREPKQAGA
ncbi:MAG: class I SAM-dependent methyltransferase [Pseudomonadota bacterium]